ncbi:MAG: DUF502 domain-containing protein [Pirellulaceae bacterium]
MSQAAESAPGSKALSSFPRHFRSRILAGLVLVVPVWVTIVVVRFIFHFLEGTSLWLIEAMLLTPWGEPLLTKWGLHREQVVHDGLAAFPLPVQWGIGVASIVLTLVILYGLGVVGANVLGKRLIRLAERIVDRVPVVKVVYSSVKKVLEAFAGEEGQTFQRVVLAPYPSKEMQSIGLVTHVEKDEQGKETSLNIFVPMSPHLTSAFVFVAKPSAVVELDWSVEQALKVIVSGGMLTPDNANLPSTIS